MNSTICIEDRTFSITHISTECATPNAMFGAAHLLIAVEPKQGGADVIIFRPRVGSGELNICSDAYIPEQFLSMVLKNTVPFNSPEGQQKYRLDASRC
jgi:hypothetical protein